MIRVAFDARTLAKPHLRGMDRYLIGLARHLPEFGVEPTFFHRSREPIPAHHREQLPVHVEGLRDWSGVHWEQVAIPRALLAGRFDLYHSPAERTLPLLAPCPRLYSFHSATELSYRHLVNTGKLPGTAADYLGYDPNRSKYHLGSHYHGACIRLVARHILTVSEFARQEIIQLYRWPEHRVTVTPLGLASEFLRPRKTEAELSAALVALGLQRPYLLYVGGFETHKNPSGLIEAFALSKKIRPELKLAMVGTGVPPSAISETIRRCNLIPGEDVHVFSNLRNELVVLYDGAELFVSMSWRESFGLPALEAMSRGVGVVASSWGATPEVAGPAGRFADPRRPVQFADTICEFLAGVPAEARATIARQRASAFTWRETARRTAEVYRDVLAERRRS